MAYKIYESDRDGRITIYPSLDEPKKRGFWGLLLSLFRGFGSDSIQNSMDVPGKKEQR